MLDRTPEQARRVFAARIAEEIRTEATRVGVNPHRLVDEVRAYVTLPPSEADDD